MIFKYEPKRFTASNRSPAKLLLHEGLYEGSNNELMICSVSYSISVLAHRVTVVNSAVQVMRTISSQGFTDEEEMKRRVSHEE